MKVLTIVLRLLIFTASLEWEKIKTEIAHFPLDVISFDLAIGETVNIGISWSDLSANIDCRLTMKDNDIYDSPSAVISGETSNFPEQITYTAPVTN